MDKKAKEALRRYKKSRQQAQSSSSSSSSDSDSSYSSSEESGERKRHHHKKKARQAARHSSSSSDDERRKREKREHCQKKLEAKRNHLKRKLKEAKLKKRAAAAAAALSGHSHRALSPATQAKLKKLAERKHLRAASKERREREREKLRAAARERERRLGSRSPTKITKIRIHQDVKRPAKSPPRMHHQLMSREKIIIQTRTRERTPSVERERRHQHTKRHHDELLRERERRDRDRERRDRDRERAEREAARDKERAEALARCQERQRERDRLAREKLRREDEEKKYGGGGSGSDRLLPRPAERELALANARGGYSSRERSLEALERSRHSTSGKRDLDPYERDYLEAERRDELRRERDYMARRRDLSPTVAEHYGGGARLRDTRELYTPEDERERGYNRQYAEEGRHPRESWMEARELRERGAPHEGRDYRDMDRDLLYDERERERVLRDRERGLAVRGDWQGDWETQPSRDRDWHEGAPPPARPPFVGGPKRPSSSGPPTESLPKLPATVPREPRASSEPDWDAEDGKEGSGSKGEPPSAYSSSTITKHSTERRWPSDWHAPAEEERATTSPILLHQRSERGGRSAYRRGGAGGSLEGERSSGGGSFRPHPPPLMTLPVQPPGGYHGAAPPTRFPSKRNMTYTNPNLLKIQAAALAAAKAAQASAVAAATTAVVAAKAAAQSAANGTTTPSILGQVSGAVKLEAIESVATPAEATQADVAEKTDSDALDKAAGELSEISDSEDEILNKAERKSRSDGEECADTDIDMTAASTVVATLVSAENDNSGGGVGTADERTAEDDEMLDFEEISDGELEEDARIKSGMGDALGVDWASLIAETRHQAECSAPLAGAEPTSAKQKWQPHRVLLDIGISMHMAGGDYATQLLTAAQTKLDMESLSAGHIKTEIKQELSDNTLDEEGTPQSERAADVSEEAAKPVVGEIALNLHPLACIQVTQRQRQLQRRQLIAGACGAHSRALSARRDLQLRRQLCGLPAQECELPSPLPATSAKLKAMALAAFQRSVVVK